MGFEDIEGPITINEVDNFEGLAMVLREVRKFYPLVQEDPLFKEKLAYAVDLGNNCLYLYFQTQQIRMALQKAAIKMVEDEETCFN